MSATSSSHLDRLREIGWRDWDPIGLVDLLSSDYCVAPLDEYDSYLLQAHEMLSRGTSVEETAIFLDWVASEHMGLGPLDDQARKASRTTVDAIVGYLTEDAEPGVTR